METLRGAGGIAPTRPRPRYRMKVSGQYPPPGNGPGILRTGGWVGQGADLVAGARIKVRDRTPDVQPTVSD